jgi:hypothetical protein
MHAICAIPSRPIPITPVSTVHTAAGDRAVTATLVPTTLGLSTADGSSLPSWARLLMITASMYEKPTAKTDQTANRIAARFRSSTRVWKVA